MTHQTLQNRQLNTGRQHLHDGRVAERARRHRHGERHVVGSGRFYHFIQPDPICPVGDCLDLRLLRSAGALIPAPQRYFQRGHHHQQLDGVLDIGQRDELMRLSPNLTLSQPAVQVGRSQEEIGPSERKSFVTTLAGVPEARHKHPAVQIRDSGAGH